ncbi:MAG: hypothetical protein K2W99_03585, partial [Chthoniobacterales bacterium]|nr:hypothetical protein [Chthoniobacterales bacterium]
LVVGPVRVSAMMEEGKKSEKPTHEEIGKYSAREEESALINNVEVSRDSSASVRGVLLKSQSSELSQGKAPVTLGDSDPGDNPEKENLFDLEVLEQRIQEAREVVTELTGKGSAIEEAELQELFQEWSERYERYAQTQSNFSNLANNISFIEQQFVVLKLEELIKASERTVEALKQSLENLTRNASTRSDLRNWRPRIDEKKELFQAPEDKAVFWTGWNGGNDPALCSLAKAKKYAALKNKVTLETTPGGEWLGKEYGWFTPSTHYTENEANAVWRHASEHYLKQVTGHVVAFILPKNHPKYNGTSIYNTIERPLLKDKDTIFLSENFVRQDSGEFLTKQQKEELNKPESRVAIQGVLNWLTKAKVAWDSIGTAEEFTQENRKRFLDNADINVKGRITEAKKQLKELNKLDRTLLEDYVLEARAVVQTWEPIYLAVRALHQFDTFKDKKYIEEARVEILTARAAITRAKHIATIERWKEECEWLQEAIQTINYYIFKAYRAGNNIDAARDWKELFLEEEVSIDDVPPLQLGREQLVEESKVAVEEQLQNPLQQNWGWKRAGLRILKPLFIFAAAYYPAAILYDNKEQVWNGANKILDFLPTHTSWIGDSAFLVEEKLWLYNKERQKNSEEKSQDDKKTVQEVKIPVLHQQKKADEMSAMAMNAGKLAQATRVKWWMTVPAKRAALCKEIIKESSAVRDFWANVADYYEASLDSIPKDLQSSWKTQLQAAEDQEKREAASVWVLCKEGETFSGTVAMRTKIAALNQNEATILDKTIETLLFLEHAADQATRLVRSTDNKTLNITTPEEITSLKKAYADAKENWAKAANYYKTTLQDIPSDLKFWWETKVQITTAYSRSMEAYQKRLDALAQKLIALNQGNQKAANMWEKKIEVESTAADAFEKAAERLIKGGNQKAVTYQKNAEHYKKVAKKYGKAASAYEQEFVARQKPNEASFSEHRRAIEINAYSNLAHALKNSAEQLENENDKAAEFYQQSAAAYAEQAAALTRNDIKAAGKHEERAAALSWAADHEERAAAPSVAKKTNVLEALQKVIEDCREYALALEKGDDKKAVKYKKKVEVEKRIAVLYEQSISILPGDSGLLRMYQEAIEALKQQIKEQEDDKAAEVYEKKAKALVDQISEFLKKKASIGNELAFKVQKIEEVNVDAILQVQAAMAAIEILQGMWF